MPQPKCLVLVHVYYPELWEEIAGYLGRLNGAPFDLYINLVEGRTTAQWRDAVCREFPRAHIVTSPNLGSDIGGTLNLMRHVDLAPYDLVCKLHTKKSTYDPPLGERWRKELLQTCLDKPAEVFEVFASNPEVTMVGSAGRISRGNGVNHRRCLELCDRLRIDRRWARSPWVAGSMFWCRQYVMQALKDAGLSQDEFIVPYGSDGTLAHVIERIFGALAASRGQIYWREPADGRPAWLHDVKPLPPRPAPRKATAGAAARRVNWFFCLNDHDNEYATCAKAAVVSATLYPISKFCIYDGNDAGLVYWMKDHGVRVVRRRFTLADRLMVSGIECPQIGLGTYLRTDIPEIAAFERLLDSPYYLYTDCDVLFQNDPSPLLDIQTESFCAAIEINESPCHFNAGVMWCNADFLMQTLPRFRQYLLEKNFQFVSYDQGALNAYYAGDRRPLGREYNWKPYWGVDPNAVIVHFHGPKPHMFRVWQRDRAEFMRQWGSVAQFICPYSQPAYEHYVGLFEHDVASVDEAGTQSRSR